MLNKKAYSSQSRHTVRNLGLAVGAVAGLSYLWHPSRNRRVNVAVVAATVVVVAVAAIGFTFLVFTYQLVALVLKAGIKSTSSRLRR